MGYWLTKNNPNRFYGRGHYLTLGWDAMVDFDRAIEILSNPTRREILKRLVREPHYPLQLSEHLDVSQQAIVKHLNVLEENGFVECEKVASQKGGPPKKIYTVQQSFSLRMDLGPDLFRMKHTPLPKGSPINLSSSRNMSDSAINIANRISGKRSVSISEGAGYISHIQGMLDNIDAERDSLVALHQHVLKRVSKTVDGEFETYNERSIVHTILENPSRPLDLDRVARDLMIHSNQRDMKIVIEGIRGHLANTNNGDVFLPADANTPLPWWVQG